MLALPGRNASTPKLAFIRSLYDWVFTSLANASSSLGLQIARTLVTEDLQGSLDLLTDNNGGTIAKISFPKAVFEGEETGFD